MLTKYVPSYLLLSHGVREMCDCNTDNESRAPLRRFDVVTRRTPQRSFLFRYSTTLKEPYDLCDFARSLLNKARAIVFALSAAWSASAQGLASWFQATRSLKLPCSTLRRKCVNTQCPPLKWAFPTQRRCDNRNWHVKTGRA